MADNISTGILSGLYEKVYNPDVLSCLANLSNDEVLKHPEDYEIADFTKETESDEAESESETAAETVNDSTDSSEEITAE